MRHVMGPAGRSGGSPRPDAEGPEDPTPTTGGAPDPVGAEMPGDVPAALSEDPTRTTGARRILAVRGGMVGERRDTLAGEEPMAIRAAGPGQTPVDVAITMRTPGEEAELAVGFLFSEGLIAPGDVEAVEVGDPAAVAHPDDEVVVRLRVPFDASAVAARNFVATASCGICGRASLDSIALRCPRVMPGPTVTRSALVGLPAALRAGQAVFERTGGLHAAGLFEPDGRLVRVAEDVGRHNALDKLIGATYLADDLPFADRVVLVSGRLAFEIVAKAGAAGTPILVAIGAPSDLAVDAAERLGMTLVGFLRGDGFNVYAGSERIDLAG